MVVKKTTAEKKEYSGFVVVNFNYISYLIFIWFTIVGKYNWTLIKWMKEVKILGNYLDVQIKMSWIMRDVSRSMDEGN